MRHKKLCLEPGAFVADGERWMADHGVDWGPVALDDRLWRFGIFPSGGHTARSLQDRLVFLERQPLFVAEVGDTLCWDGKRVQLHASRRQGVETCTSPMSGR